MKLYLFIQKNHNQNILKILRKREKLKNIDKKNLYTQT